MTTEERSYPRDVEVDGTRIEFRLMGKDDGDALVSFAAELPRHDLLFLRRDITKTRAVDEWIRDIEQGAVTTVLATIDGDVIGYGTLHRSELRWSSHVAELRILVAEAWRRRGLGRILTQEIFALAISRGIEKLVARMTLDQKGAMSVFEGLGFRPEALQRDHVKDLDGNPHDLVTMALSVEEFHGTLDAYGVPDNVGAS